jgi:hypothetical protein
VTWDYSHCFAVRVIEGGSSSTTKKPFSLRAIWAFYPLFLTQASLVTTAHKKSPIHFVYQASFFCDPVGIRTPNLRIRNAMLYPVELQGQFELKDEFQTDGKDTHVEASCKF